MTRPRLVLLAFAVLCACNSSKKTDEEIAQQYCSACHLFPEPALLDKETWQKHVLPQMAFRMGFDNPQLLAEIPFNDLEAVLRILPSKPITTTEEWQAIERYYLQHAPDSLAPIEHHADSFIGFNPLAPPGNFAAVTTAITIDSVGHRILAGNRFSQYFAFNKQLVVVDSGKVGSAPSRITVVDSNTLRFSLMGIMDPNDQPAGQLTQLNLSTRAVHVIADSLKRPVFDASADLDDDGAEDYVVCNFGNYTGNLIALFGNEDRKFERVTLSALPGARKVILKDFTGDGRIDVMVLFAQGDERVSLFVNDGARKFTEKILLRFPPVYGSSYFETGDFNSDGFFDILVTNGDNMDYSIVLKPYHGVRLFLNDGKMNFTESIFLPMHGASMAMAHDYDLDGDIDIAAIAFFPDFKNHSDEGFVYFENTGNNHFVSHTTSASTQARWLIMETADYDSDGDVDIFLGALNFPTPVPAINKMWGEKPIPFLVLNNQAANQAARR